MRLSKSNSQRKLYAIKSHKVKTPTKKDHEDIVDIRLGRNKVIEEIPSENSMLHDKEFMTK